LVGAGTTTVVYNGNRFGTGGGTPAVIVAGTDIGIT
jgi:hypothetical protein